MADLTQGAVSALLGVLKTAVKSEAELQKGVERDIQFIKDEMDSMNGFLLHLNKSGNEHDDQQRAWMKQVRAIAYAAHDCIELYNLYGELPPCNGVSSALRFVPSLARAVAERHRLATKIKELKERVRDVGERRERYGVTVPPTEHARKTRSSDAAGDDAEAVNKARQEFLEALRQDEEEAFFSSESSDAEKDHEGGRRLSSMVRRWLLPAPPPFERAVGKLAPELAPHARKIREALLNSARRKRKKKKHSSKHDAADDRRRLLHQHDAAAICIGMVLRALHAFPHSRVGNEEELNKLVEAAMDGTAADLPKRVMTFCYSELTTAQKSCLQYLAAFRQETSISRTSLVRRCAAERLVSVNDDDDDDAKEQQQQLSIEQRAESCFEELLFRGFVSPDAHGAAGKVKSCRFRSESVKDFIVEMCKAENFVGGGLPVHLQIQNEIRTAALDQQHQRRRRDDEQLRQLPRVCMLLLVAAGGRQMRLQNDPVNKMLRELDALPKSYRLNVMDLGGCVGILRRSHLVSICKLRTLKYLSLRNTDVRALPSQLQDLRLLETLDIRQTNIPRGGRGRCRSSQALLPGTLKHFLAGNVASQGDAPNATVRIPASIREMVALEILAHVKVCRGRELRRVENLTNLRKLGVVLAPATNDEDGTMKALLRAVGRLSGCLHSLSVRMERAPLNGWLDTLDGGAQQQQPVPSNLVSLRIDGSMASGLPSWVERLCKLEKITLCNTTLSEQKLGALGELPALACLRLRHKSYSGRELAFRKPGGFPALRFLRIEGVLVVTELTFQADSAPELEKIVWSSADRAATDDALVAAITVSVAGVENLPKLKEVVLHGLREQHPSTLAKDIAKHPNRPRFFNTQGH